VLRDARVPACLLDPPPPGAPTSAEGVARVDLAVAGGRIAAVAPAGAGPDLGAEVPLGGRMVWPTLVDAHAHLDKGHVVYRTPNPNGTFAGARDATTRDRVAFWCHADVRRRMDFGLRCALAHGVAAIRTHLDSHEGQAETSWEVFRELREAWAGRIALQAAALVPLDVFRTAYAERLADIVAASGGIMGGVTRATGGGHGQPLADLDVLLDRLFGLAAGRGLDIDLHVDESADVEVAALAAVARATLRHGYAGRVTCGHCCSLALQPPAVIDATIELLAEARIAVITLPTVNMYLQDRAAGRTPRWRGVAPVHELRAAGVPVAAAGDNCRDAFYAYGDHDMLDTFRAAVRILHLDHPLAEAPALVARAPAAIMGLDGQGLIRAGRPADLIVMSARSLNEVLSRPQADRLVLRAGRALAGGLPDHAELDELVGAPP
jgi:cytosine deaminase